METSKLFCYLIKVVHNSNIANYSLDKAFRRNYFMHTLWVLIGEKILGSWGPHVAGMAIVPSIIGAVILVAVVSFLFGRKNS